MNTSILPPAPSVDDLMRMIAETHRSIVDMREQSKETDRLLRESRERSERQFRESRELSERQFQESREQSERLLRDSREETERGMRKLQEQIAATDRQLAATGRQLAATDRQLAATDKQLGKLGNRLGEFVEYMVRPAAVRLFQERKLDVHQVIPNLCAYDDNRQLRSQVDLLVINNATAIVVECKSACSIDDVKEHLERLAEFKDCFPQYQPFDLLGAVAAMVMPDEVGRLAYRQGLFVMVQNGEIMDIRNDDKFQPKTW